MLDYPTIGMRNRLIKYNLLAILMCVDVISNDYDI